MEFSHPTGPLDDGSSPNGGEPLVPILRLEDGLGDPVALETWHEALSDALVLDLPHSLLGLWLYPTEGGVVLLGPSALAQDDLAIPLPDPQLEPRRLGILEEIIRDAGYESVACMPIRSGKRDVGLLLIADLQAGRYREAQLLLLRRVTQRLAPLFGRIARHWGQPSGAAHQPERIAALVDAVAQANIHSGNPQQFVQAVGRAIELLVPHDHIELLLADRGGTRYYRLGEHAGGEIWGDPSLVVSRTLLDPETLSGGSDRLLLPDSYRIPAWPRGYLTAEDPPGADLRGVIGCRVSDPRGLRAWLLVGSVGPNLYTEDDVALLTRLGALVAPQIALLEMSSDGADRGGRQDGRGQPTRLLEAAELLATGADFADSLRKVRELAGRSLPFDELRCAIRLCEGDRVVLLEPGERRPLPDLALIPVAGTTLAGVLQGDLPSAFALVDGEARLIVPLRVSGRVHGALVFTAARPAVLNAAHLPEAQQLADLLAPHLELLRRTALLPPPYTPGWKKVKGE
jgi:hypothetical protein